ncbi:hypothetical protein [Nonomuraea helvata]|uniref:Uncharacterized protein n=1 Tax=Nonomuraea helvata TaxID=37484 RepID=A0ABV5SH34_9ACTN
MTRGMAAYLIALGGLTRAAALAALLVLIAALVRLLPRTTATG